MVAVDNFAKEEKVMGVIPTQPHHSSRVSSGSPKRRERRIWKAISFAQTSRVQRVAVARETSAMICTSATES